MVETGSHILIWNSIFHASDTLAARAHTFATQHLGDAIKT
jgi:hypothetical protein